LLGTFKDGILPHIAVLGDPNVSMLITCSAIARKVDAGEDFM
jgi:hypothetical protein